MKNESRCAAIYVRVSTGSQTTENQLRELRTVAERHGWKIVTEFSDKGISGAKGREQRPGLNKLLKAVACREIDIVLAWSVDRLGRSLQDLLSLLAELHAKGIDLYLHQQGLDTSTPAGKALFQMMGVFSEFERAIISERVRSGLERAKARFSVAAGTTIRSEWHLFLSLRKKGVGIGKIARTSALVLAMFSASWRRANGR
jgi:DNA invertase Pin-like site-specific DNA recombinase